MQLATPNDRYTNVPYCYGSWLDNTLSNIDIRNNVYTLKYIFKNADQKLYIDGTLKKSSAKGTPGNCELRLSASDSGHRAMNRIYWAKLYKGDTLVRDFIPVRDSFNVPAMYDQVSGKL